jgi:hypothetical protein
VEPVDRAESTSTRGDIDEVDLEDISLGQRKKDQKSEIDVVSILIALGFGSAVVWYFFYRG